jgi:hypothetical protein
MSGNGVTSELDGEEDRPLPNRFGMMMKIAIGIQRAAALDQPFGIVVLGAERRRIDNHVVLPRVQRAVGLVGEPHGREDDA